MFPALAAKKHFSASAHYSAQPLPHYLHAPRRRFGNHLHTPRARHPYRVRVNKHHLSPRRHITYQSRSRIHIKRRAHYQKHISPRSSLGSHLKHRHRLAKPHNKRTLQRPVTRQLPMLHHLARSQTPPVTRIIRRRRRAHITQLTMQVNHISRPRPLMQVVHILRHHRHVKVTLKLSQNAVPRVRLSLVKLTAQPVVKVRHQPRVSSPPLRRSHLLHRVAPPQTTGTPECRKTTLRTNTSARKRHNLLLRHNLNNKVTKHPKYTKTPPSVTQMQEIIVLLHPNHTK